jgi:4-hydroxy-2-oxoheptanedioate aldolase
MKSIKDRLRTGDSLHGSWVNLGSAVSAEIMGSAGFDWLLVDLEHGAGNDAIMYQQLQALESTPSSVIVRTDEISRPKTQRILDAGASGVMYPRIEGAQEAAHAVSMLYYPPRGVRGMARMVRATAFGGAGGDHLEMEKNLVGMIQIETINATKEIDAIASIEGVDVLFVGPSDLSLALGIFRQFNHPAYQDAIRKVAESAQKHKKAAGVLLQDLAEYEMYHRLGYRVLACGGDAAFVASSARNMAKQMKDKGAQG